MERMKAREQVLFSDRKKGQFEIISLRGRILPCQAATVQQETGSQRKMVNESKAVWEG